jgi:hypothetical protein
VLDPSHEWSYPIEPAVTRQVSAELSCRRLRTIRYVQNAGFQTASVRPSSAER